MKIEKIWLDQFIPTDGLVVVIDVIRAFTTAANAFYHGAKEIIPVLEIKDVFDLHEQYPNTLMMGEFKKEKVEGFDFGNSPTQFIGHSINGSTIIQRTTCGTQGVIRALKAADHILVGSFVIAKATAERILQINPQKVTLLMTSIVKGDEDAAFADYLEELLLRGEVDPAPYLKRTEAQEAPVDQKASIMALDQFPFAIELFDKETLPILKPVYPNGTVYSS